MSQNGAPLLSGARLNAVLFLLTVASVFYVGRPARLVAFGEPWYVTWLSGWQFAVPLLAILVAHESGHYIAARIHRVPASLPYFLPVPFPQLSPFGTLGAIIVMPGRIRSARALLDIGAAGPLAGMLLAIPTMILGLAMSPVMPRMASGYTQEGQSLLYIALKRLVHGPIPATHDVILHPVAFAAWVGFFITFLNLVPFSQLDGGHVAYALFGRRHDKWSRQMWLVPALALVYNLLTAARPALTTILHSGFGSLTNEQIAPASSSVSFWLLPLVIVVAIRLRSGGTHPPVDDATLDRKRRAVAIATLALFVLLFMPAPLVFY